MKVTYKDLLITLFRIYRSFIKNLLEFYCLNFSMIKLSMIKAFEEKVEIAEIAEKVAIEEIAEIEKIGSPAAGSA